VVPPFDSIRFPSLGCSVLAASLRARGIKTAVVYGSLQLAARIGYAAYGAFCQGWTSGMQGERLFVSHAYPKAALKTLGALRPLSAKLQRLSDEAAPEIGPFLRALAQDVLARKPKIVGISTSFQQNMAAIALARILKRRQPAIRVVLGGANCAEPMGSGLLAVFPWIDHVFSAEADIAFPDFCESLVRDGRSTAPQLVDCAPITDMGKVHAPDFTDYFAALRPLQKSGRLPDALPRFLVMESSRGCWWGEKHHCTFCGLNGEGMDFRKKSASRVLEEIRDMTQAWGIGRVHAADNIMPLNFLKDVLPELAQWPQHPKLFYEVKANLRDDQLATMAGAGVDMIQPGIESLSSHVLKLMRKGVSALQNLALLRDCRSRDIHVLWNVLFGFPGEEAADYEAMLALLPKIAHLQAPSGFNPIVIDRFSPYHANYRDFGISAIAPYPNYAGLYPKDAPLGDIAYHFRGRYSTALLEDTALVRAMREAIAQWKLRWAQAGKEPRLEALETDGSEICIADTRAMAKEPLVVVTPQAMAALVHFERARPRDGAHGEHAAEIDALLARDFLIEYEGALMSVVTRRKSVARAPARRAAAVASRDLETAVL